MLYLVDSTITESYEIDETRLIESFNQLIPKLRDWNFESDDIYLSTKPIMTIDPEILKLCHIDDVIEQMRIYKHISGIRDNGYSTHVSYIVYDYIHSWKLDHDEDILDELPNFIDYIDEIIRKYAEFDHLFDYIDEYKNYSDTEETDETEETEAMDAFIYVIQKHTSELVQSGKYLDILKHKEYYVITSIRDYINSIYGYCEEFFQNMSGFDNYNKQLSLQLKENIRWSKIIQTINVIKQMVQTINQKTMIIMADVREYKIGNNVPEYTKEIKVVLEYIDEILRVLRANESYMHIMDQWTTDMIIRVNTIIDNMHDKVRWRHNDDITDRLRLAE
jgi:hypothetical protein